MDITSEMEDQQFYIELPWTDQKPDKSVEWTIFAREYCGHSSAAVELVKSRIEHMVNQGEPPENMLAKIYIVSLDDTEKLKKEFDKEKLLTYTDGNTDVHDTFPIIYENGKLFGGNAEFQEIYRNPR